MDEFEVTAKNVSLLRGSLLIEEIRTDVQQRETFPVLINKKVAHFHDVQGGYDESTGCHVVSLIHRVQGDGSPTRTDNEINVEIHGDSKAFSLDVHDRYSFGEYPDADYTLCLQVQDYTITDRSFADEMDAEIDKRETRFE